MLSSAVNKYVYVTHSTQWRTVSFGTVVKPAAEVKHSFTGAEHSLTTGDLPVSRPDSLIGRLQQYETNLVEDIIMSGLIFLTISAAWEYAPESWPQVIYYLALGVGLFGYFRYVSPPPSNT